MLRLGRFLRVGVHPRLRSSLSSEVVPEKAAGSTNPPRPAPPAQSPHAAHPAPNGLVGDHNAALRQQILDVTKAQREPEIEPDRLSDDFGWEPGSLVADFLHPLGFLTASEAASPNCRDNAGKSALGLVNVPTARRQQDLCGHALMGLGVQAAALRGGAPKISSLSAAMASHSLVVSTP
jgi:hypothetical protein